MCVRKQRPWMVREEVFAQIEAHALGAWVCHAAEGLVANHVSFIPGCISDGLP